MQKRNPSDFDDYLAIVRRQWPFLVVPFVICTFLTLVIGAKLPKYYRSETLILVDPQKLPPEIVKSAGTDVSERLQVISQQVLSRTQLEKIIAQFDLYRDKKLTKEDTVEQMRKDIEVNVVQDERARESDRTVSAFKVSYTGRSPEQAQNVTRQLASLFIEENLRVREQVAEGTNEFVDSELQRARDELAKQEEQIREFKNKYSGMLPEQQQANLQVLGQLQQMLQSNTESLSRAQQQKQYLASLAEATKGTPQQSRDAAQLEALKAELVTAQQKYTDSHPDVIRLKAQVQALEQQVKQTAQAELTPQITSQLTAADEEVKSRAKRGAEIEAKIRSIQGRMETLPAIEQQFSSLSRDYEVSKANYQSLLQKKNLSAMHVEMERNAKGENFRVLDPASLPEKPSKPNMLQVTAVGLMAGLALGGGIVFLREMKNEAVFNEKDLQHYIPLRVLGVVPEIATKESMAASKARRRKTISISVASAAAMCSVIAVLIMRGTIDLRGWF
jgi:polysaccharide chain length determinant protein (PEP-CTERM system associated)